MDQLSLESTLADLMLPAIRYFSSTGSTNDDAWQWFDAGAPHGALVVADEQTAGRGRHERRWVTTAGSGLAFSLVLQSPPLTPQLVYRLTGLGALAICNALRTNYALPAQIKWPNDILVRQHKLAGVLVEARWDGEQLKAAVIGIGINIAPESVNPANFQAQDLNFPATCVEDTLGHPVDRQELLYAVLDELFSWLPRLSSPGFIHQWEKYLAYRNQWVELTVDNASRSNQIGKVIGLTSDGSLKLLTRTGELVTAQVGEIHLKPTPLGQPSRELD